MITIIPFHDANPDAVRRIYAESVAANPQGFVQDLSFHGDIMAQAADMAAEGGAFLVALLEDMPIGIGGLKPEKEDGVYELCKLHVLKEHHGKGYGKMLSWGLIDAARAKEAVAVTLHVTATQEAAISLYERLGFERTDRKTYDVQIGNTVQSFDTVFMRLAL
jgi:ribosomal protein S18 acetylase RimI-like enzyme